MSEQSPYASVNAGARVEVFDEPFDTDYEVAVRRFLRRAGLADLYSERIVPTINSDDSAVFLGVVDRPWPPWGLGAHSVLALCQIQLVGDARYAVSPVYSDPWHTTNIGLTAAVYKEVLDHVAQSGGEVNYLVRDGARFAASALLPAGFSRVEEFFVTEAGRYYVYRAQAKQLKNDLGLQIISADLLAEDIAESDYARLAAFFTQIWFATNAGEIIAIDGGLDDSLPPTTILGTAGPPVLLPEGETQVA